MVRDLLLIKKSVEHCGRVDLSKFSKSVLEVEKKKCWYSPDTPPPLFIHLFIYLLIYIKYISTF